MIGAVACGVAVVCAVANSCHAPDKIGLNKQENIARFIDKLLVTSRPFTPLEAHVSGFSMKALNSYLDRSANDMSELPLAKSSVFGGSRAYLEVATLALDAIASTTLRAGHMGSADQIVTYVPLH